MTDALEARIDSLMRRFVQADGPGAAIGVVRDGRFVLRKAYGLADLEWQVPLTPDTVFRIASVTKPFTAMAVMILAERGLLDVEAPLETYLPGWSARGRRVTLRRLLDHTSGIWRHDNGTLPDRTRRSNLPLAETLAMIHAGDFEFEPGERYVYNNSGYMLLGQVIETVTGLGFGEVLQREIFEPLGMTQTGLLDPGTVTRKRAHGYVRGRRGFHNARPDAFNWSFAAGGLGSTLDDLARWEAGLRAHRLVRPQTFEAMLAPVRLNDGGDYPYGFGWGLATYEGHRVRHHTGGVSGYACQLASFRDASLTTIVLSNLYLFPFDQVTRGLMRAALDLPDVAPGHATLSAPELAACAGVFEAPLIPRRILAAQDGALAFQEPGHLRLEPSAPDRFHEPGDPEIGYRFSEPRDGRYQRFDWCSPLWPPTTYRRTT